MEGKQKKRSLYNYIKLSDDYPAAITWMEGKDKLARLFESESKARGYLSIHRNLAIEKGAKVVVGYIPKPAYGIVIDWETGKAMIDSSTGLPNTCKAIDKLNGLKIKARNITGSAKKLKEARSEVAQELERIDSCLVESSMDLTSCRRYLERIEHIKHKIGLMMRDLEKVMVEVVESTKID